MTWTNQCVCGDTDGLTDEEKWFKLYGTDFVGNLPVNKKSRHVGNCWNPCPYDITMHEGKSAIMLGLSDISDINRTDHMYEDKHHFMRPYSKISVWGYLCTDPNCPYLIDNGEPFFYK